MPWHDQPFSALADAAAARRGLVRSRVAEPRLVERARSNRSVDEPAGVADVVLHQLARARPRRGARSPRGSPACSRTFSREQRRALAEHEAAEVAREAAMEMRERRARARRCPPPPGSPGGTASFARPQRAISSSDGSRLSGARLDASASSASRNCACASCSRSSWSWRITQAPRARRRGLRAPRAPRRRRGSRAARGRARARRGSAAARRGRSPGASAAPRGSACG